TPPKAERRGGAVEVGEHASVVAHELDPTAPELLEDVDHEALVLTPLPDEAAETSFSGSLHHDSGLAGPLVVTSRRRGSAGSEEAAPIVEQTDVPDPRHRPHAPIDHGRGDGRLEVVAALGGRPAVGEVEQPSRAGELGSPDDVEHQHVEAGRPAFEIDHVELVLDV